MKKRKKLTIATLLTLFFSVLTFSSCELDDDSVARWLSGTWYVTDVYYTSWSYEQPFYSGDRFVFYENGYVNAVDEWNNLLEEGDWTMNYDWRVGKYVLNIYFNYISYHPTITATLSPYSDIDIELDGYDDRAGLFNMLLQRIPTYAKPNSMTRTSPTEQKTDLDSVEVTKQ